MVPDIDVDVSEAVGVVGTVVTDVSIFETVVTDEAVDTVVDVIVVGSVVVTVVGSVVVTTVVVAVVVMSDMARFKIICISSGVKFTKPK